MLNSLLWLSLLAAPLLAQPIRLDSLIKRDDAVSLEIYIDSTKFPDAEALKLVKFSINDPVKTEPTT